MLLKEGFRGQQPAEPLIELPNVVTEHDLHRIEVYLRTKSLGGSVSQVIIDESTKLMAEELDLWNNLDYETFPDPFDRNLYVCWDGYQRPALAYLNAEEVLRGKLPYEEPDMVVQNVVGDRKFVASFLGIDLDEESIAAQVVAQWHIGIEQYLARLIQTGSPLELVDKVVEVELSRPLNKFTDDVNYHRDLTRGQFRFRELYNAGLPLFELRKLESPTQ